MGTTSEKLTYLNDTKQLLKENINNLGGNLTTEPFRQYASVLEGIYERIPKVSGIGASLSLSPSLMGKIKLNEIQGNTLQNGTPTPDSPVPIQSVTGLQNVNVCGKNLFEPVLTIDGTNINLTNCTVNKNNDVLSFTATAKDWRFGDLCTTGQSYQKTYGVLIEVNEEETYSFTFSNTNIIKNYITFYNANKISLGYVYKDTNSFTYTMPSDTKYISLRIGLGQATVVGETYTTTIQIEKGSTATSYEPYNGNTYEVNLGDIELNKIGDYQDSIKKSTGIQLFDKDNMQTLNAYIGGSSGTITASDGDKVLYIPIESNTTYTISKTIDATKNRFRIGFTNSIPISGTISSPYSGNQDTQSSYTITSGATSKYLVLYYYTTGGALTEQQVLDSIMINEGSTALPYEPYGKVWYVEKNIGKTILDGTQNFSKRNDGDGSTTISFQYNLRTGAYGSDKEYCNRFVYEQSSSSGNEGIGIADQLTNIYFQIKRSRLSSLDVTGFKNWLSSNNVEILYILPTPIYEVITNTELIEQLESLNNAKSEDGTTNINVTSENLAMLLNVGVLKGE